MSDTPRTDAATLRYRYYEKRGDWHGQDYFDYVEPESMAELERELAAANARVDSARRDALEQIAKLVDKKVSNLADGNGYVEDDTNAFIWTNKEAEWVAIVMEEFAEELRALINAAPQVLQENPELKDAGAPATDNPPAGAAPNTAAVAQQVAGCPPLNAEDKRHGNPPPPAVPALPDEPEFKRLRSGLQAMPGGNVEATYSQYCMKADYDTLRTLAERLRVQAYAYHGALDDALQRAERAEAECKRLKGENEFMSGVLNAAIRPDVHALLQQECARLREQYAALVEAARKFDRGLVTVTESEYEMRQALAALDEKVNT